MILAKNQEMQKNSYDIIVIGSGPAGCSAAIYGSQAGKRVLMVSGYVEGGVIVTTKTVSNYPGFIEISGPDLANNLFNHAKSLCEVVNDFVIDIDKVDNLFRVSSHSACYFARSVIVCTGSESKSLPQLKDYQQGIYYCAICDGNVTKNKVAVIVGGGNVAYESAVYLASIAKKVYLIIRNEPKAFDNLQKKVDFFARKSIEENSNEKKIEILKYSEVSDLKYENGSLKSLTVVNNKNNTSEEIQASSIFVCIGHRPKTDILKNFINKGEVLIDKDGYVSVQENFSSTLDGLFVAGDLVKKKYFQIISAANDGMIAALSASEYLDEKDMNNAAAQEKQQNDKKPIVELFSRILQILSRMAA